MYEFNPPRQIRFSMGLARYSFLSYVSGKAVECFFHLSKFPKPGCDVMKGAEQRLSRTSVVSMRLAARSRM